MSAPERVEASRAGCLKPLSLAVAARDPPADLNVQACSRQPILGLLLLEWHEATLYSSSLTEIIAHPSYQRIIGMGRDALPFILAALRREPDHWHWALFSITGANPVPPEASGNLEKTRDAWLNWAASSVYSKPFRGWRRAADSSPARH